jgi:hypothetical protein
MARSEQLWGMLCFPPFFQWNALDHCVDYTFLIHTLYYLKQNVGPVNREQRWLPGSAVVRVCRMVTARSENTTTIVLI